MRIKRSEILKAIRTEPLKAGHWVAKNTGDKACKVCAVGAILRYKGVENWDIGQMACDLTRNYQGVGFCAEDDEEKALEKGLYLNALSIKFEKLAKKLGAGNRTRLQLSRFVKKNFPKTITVLG